MSRTRQIAPVQKAFGATEQDRARDMGAANRRLEAAQQKLAELRRYRDDYSNSFQSKARGGTGVVALRDFQAFLARLDLALRQQEQLVHQAREEQLAHTRQWQSAARRARALDTVVDRWHGEERRQEERSEQRQTDERAQRGAGGQPGHTGDRS